MTKFSIDRKIEIDAGHRVPLHGSKCRNVHGHRYVIEALCESDSLFTTGEQQGMVLDFSFLKEEMVDEIHNPCDHATIFDVSDPILDTLVSSEVMDISIRPAVKNYGYCQTQTIYWKIYIIEGPPTAEVLAKHWFDRLEPRIIERSDGNAKLKAIRVHETPNCSAFYSPEKAKKGAKVEQLKGAQAV